MTKYKYAVIATFKNMNHDAILAYCDSEQEAISTMEEFEDYISHSGCDSAYKQIESLCIFKYERIVL